MSIVETSKKEYVNNFYLEQLKNGVIPSSSSIDSLLSSLDSSFFDKPISYSKNWQIKSGSSSSSQLIEEIAKTLNFDLSILSKEIYRISNNSEQFYFRWLNEIKRLFAKSKNLESRINSLLLLTNESLGFFSFINDSFFDLTKVNTSLTSARINTTEGSVSIQPIHSETTNTGSIIDLSHLKEIDISFSLLTNRPNVTFTSTGSILNILNSYNSKWIGKISSASYGDMVCELKLNLKKEFNISKVSFNFLSSIGSESTVTCLYSTNGNLWSLIPSVEATKALSRQNYWNFSMIKARWIKIIIRKSTFDKNTSDYLYSISNLSMFNSEFSSENKSVFISSLLSAKDKTNSDIEFSSVALETCQTTPENTGIDFFVSTGEDWIPISPINIEDKSKTKIVNFGSSILNDNINSSVFDINKSSLSFTQTTNVNDYIFKNQRLGIVNTKISSPNSNVLDFISKNIVVWRNIRSNHFAPMSSLLVRNNIRGWNYNGELYSCMFEITDSNGLNIDFGKTTCFINDINVSGLINLPTGIYKFSTKSENWYDINNALIPIQTTFSEADLKTIDPLYPYNHKLLIEGLSYPLFFENIKVYTGSSISAEFLCNKITLFELENKGVNYKNFALKGFANEQINNQEVYTMGIVIQSDISNNDFSNELFFTKWKTSSSENLHKYVKIKAEFWTKDSGITPILNSYRLKLGN